MSKQPLTWIEHIRSLQKNLQNSPSAFVTQFSLRLTEAVEQFIKEQASLPLISHRETSSQKAFIHALQLYDSTSLLKLIANYDSGQEIQAIGGAAIKKTLHSLYVIPNLENVAVTPMEKDTLLAYTNQLRTHLMHALSCSVEHLSQPRTIEQILNSFAKKQTFDDAYIKTFFTERLELLFSSAYQTYLILRNRYFLDYLREKSENKKQSDWLHDMLDQIKDVSEEDLAVRLTSLNFRTVEYLVQLIRQAFPSSNAHQEQHAQPLIEAVCEGDNLFFDKTPAFSPTISSKSIVQLLRNIENIPVTPPLAKESTEDGTPPSTQAPNYPLQRSPFEELCFQYLEEIIYLANHTELLTDCSAPYLFPKIEEYISAQNQVFEEFFNNDSNVLGELTNFTTQLLQRTELENPFGIQKEEIGIFTWAERDWHVTGTQERNREWTVLLKSRLPLAMPLSYGYNEFRIEKGRSFIIQFGTTYFDYDLPKQKQHRSSLAGYFKVLVRGTQLAPNSAVIYAGNDPFYKLTDSQLRQWQGLILLYLIVIRNKYGIELPEALKDYLVRKIPQTLTKKKVGRRSLSK
ncbi:MAG: hypothetical protein HQM14_02535 [SAR324 cluster bacterium]|nr:hypothetical protein [SAR324 cluster bacterium]